MKNKINLFVHFLYDYVFTLDCMLIILICSGPTRESLQGGTRLLWCPEFRSLSEFYIIIILNKLNIFENTTKKLNKSK